MYRFITQALLKYLFLTIWDQFLLYPDKSQQVVYVNKLATYISMIRKSEQIISAGLNGSKS